MKRSQSIVLTVVAAGLSASRAQTTSVLTVYLSGPSAQKQVIQPHARVPVTLPPGVYKLAGELADKSVLPFFAVRNYSGGETEQFHIVPR